MATTDPSFQGMSEMMQQSFEQTRKTMESCMDVFQKNMTASPWFASSDMNKKMQSYMERNIAAASDFAKKLTQAKDFSEFWNLQSEFTAAQWNALNEQIKDFGETVSKATTGSLKNLSS